MSHPTKFTNNDLAKIMGFNVGKKYMSRLSIVGDKQVLECIMYYGLVCLKDSSGEIHPVKSFIDRDVWLLEE